MICINCEKNECFKYSKYTSGEFCSKFCSRAYSSKLKRKEINKKIKFTFSLRRKKDVINLCKNCNIEFQVVWSKSGQKFCSQSCGAIYNNASEERKSNLRKNRIEKIKNGIVNGNGVKSTYLFNGVEIKCDSNIEKACLHYFQSLGSSKMKRCDLQIEYSIDGCKKTYLPDFEIHLNDKIYIVEAKGEMFLKTINQKWRSYNEVSMMKKKVLEDYCIKNGYLSFWFTPNLHKGYYRRLSVKN
jgi:hypothetical protein